MTIAAKGITMMFTKTTLQAQRRILLTLVAATLPTMAWAADSQKDDDRGAFWGRFNGKLSLGAMGGVNNTSNLVSANDDGSLSGVSTDKRGKGWKLFATYQPWENVGFEFAYSDQGNNSFRGTSAGGPSWAAGAIGTDHEAHGWELNIYDRIPITDRFTLFVKAGLYGWSSTQTYYENGGATVTVDKNSGTDPTYGLGFEYDVGVKDRFFWRGELQHYTVDPDNLKSNALWIGIVYRR